MSIDAYRSVSIDSAPRELWPSMAYSNVLRLIGSAKAAMSRGDVEAAHNALVRAQQIVLMLRSSLDKNAGDLAQRLEQIYGYVLSELQGANLAKDAARLDALVPILAPLRDAWEQAGRAALRGASGPGAAGSAGGGGRGPGGSTA